MEPTLREQQPPDLRSLLQTLWRRRWLFLGIFVSIPVAVYVISNLIPKTFEASALVRLQAIQTDVAAAATATNLDTEALLIQTDEVAAETADEVGGGESAGSIDQAVSTEPFTTGSGNPTDLLLITTEAGSGERAAEIANAYVRALAEVRTGKALRQINQSLARLQAESEQVNDPVAESELARQVQVLRGARADAQDNTQVVQLAAVPKTQVSPAPRRNTALAAVVALLLALGAVAVRERLDRGLREPEDLEPLLGAPLLSVIPRAAFPGARPAPTPVREAFATLAASLVYFNVDRRLATVIVASPTKGDGKTTVATHLAIALARDGQDVVLADCDLRHPQVAVRLGVEPRAGVAEVLTERANLRDALTDVDVGEGRLRVLAGGALPPNPARLISSDRMDSLLVELSELTDIVILDVPPILHVSDALPLIERASGIVLVAKVGHTSRDALQRVRQVIETARGNVLGAVATGSSTAGLYGYGTEYYGAEDVGPEETMPVRIPDLAGTEAELAAGQLTLEESAVGAPAKQPERRAEASDEATATAPQPAAQSNPAALREPAPEMPGAETSQPKRPTAVPAPNDEVAAEGVSRDARREAEAPTKPAEAPVEEPEAPAEEAEETAEEAEAPDELSSEEAGQPGRRGRRRWLLFGRRLPAEAEVVDDEEGSQAAEEAEELEQEPPDDDAEAGAAGDEEGEATTETKRRRWWRRRRAADDEESDAEASATEDEDDSEQPDDSAQAREGVDDADDAEDVQLPADADDDQESNADPNDDDQEPGTEATASDAERAKREARRAAREARRNQKHEQKA